MFKGILADKEPYFDIDELVDIDLSEDVYDPYVVVGIDIGYIKKYDKYDFLYTLVSECDYPTYLHLSKLYANNEISPDDFAEKLFEIQTLQCTLRDLITDEEHADLPQEYK